MTCKSSVKTTSKTFANLESYIFRYLLLMYELLKTDHYIRSFSQTSAMNDNSSKSQIAELQVRIKHVCQGHLRWSFGQDVLLASQSWPIPSKSENKAEQRANEVRGKAFTGSLQLLKLFEFSRVFTDETLLIDECLRRGGFSWLDALIAGRDMKSGLWYKDTKRTYVAWEGHRDEGSEWLYLPDYRLGDLIFIWKALKSLEKMIRASNDKKLASNIWQKLKEENLKNTDVRKTILRRFLYQVADTHTGRSVKQRKSNVLKESIENVKVSSSPFSIAVRRSRERDRRLFYAKDTMLFDGIQWAFFQNDIEVQVLTTQNVVRKPNIQLSWQNTMQAQGVDHEAIWEKPLRYAQAITMASLTSLDRSTNSEDLEKMCWETLLKCVLSCGLFAKEIDWDTKLPSWSPLEGSYRSHWEIPTLLLRRKIATLELDL